MCELGGGRVQEDSYIINEPPKARGMGWGGDEKTGGAIVSSRLVDGRQAGATFPREAGSVERAAVRRARQRGHAMARDEHGRRRACRDPSEGFLLR